MIPIEARKYIPVPISEVALDWYIIPKDNSIVPEGGPTLTEEEKKARNKMEVLIVALHNDTINKYKEIVTKSQLDAGFFEIEIFSKFCLKEIRRKPSDDEKHKI